MGGSREAPGQPLSQKTFRAFSKSATRSSASSMPTETRIMPGVMPIFRRVSSGTPMWEEVTGWLSVVCRPPREPTPTAPPTATQMASKGETFPVRFWPEDFMEPRAFLKIRPK